MFNVVVEPSCQGLVFGRAVMERLVVELWRKGVGNILRRWRALDADPVPSVYGILACEIS